MLQDLEVRTISLSDAAAKAIRDIVEERKLEGYALRVYMAGSGCCSGVSFGMALDNNIRDVDRTFDSGGVRVVVDQVSMDYLNGAKIDFVNDPQRGALLWCGMNAYAGDLDFEIPICSDGWLKLIDTALPAGDDLPEQPGRISGATTTVQSRSLVLLAAAPLMPQQPGTA